jgi:hypothetical protein
MTPLNYKVYLTAELTLVLQAAKLNTGEHRLWFFDQDNNLIALFKWANILGFTVEGPAQGQILTDKIPIEMGKVAEDELGLHGWLHLKSFQQLLEPISDAELGL